MISPRSLRNSVKTPPKDTRPQVNLFKIDFPNNPPKRIRLPKDIAELLTIATEVLELPRPAKQVFDVDSNAVVDIKDITPKMNLYISCANPVNDNFDDNVYKSRLPRFQPGSVNKKLPNVKQPKPKERREDAPQHQAIAASSYTVRENMRNAILALYSSLTPDHKAAIPCNDALQKLTKDTSQFLVEDSLLGQFIGPSTVISGTPLGQQTNNWMMEKLKGLTVDQCKFVITGPSQSGKSTLLSIAVSLFYQKLQVSSEAENYLFCPINWLMQQICLEDFQKLYALIVTTTINMIKATHFEYIPIINSLHQWFLSLITMTALLPLPAPIQHFPGFPVDIICSHGRKIHENWTQKKFKAFLTDTINFPNVIAKAFQYKAVVWVLDHFDASGYAIKPVDHFEGAEEEEEAVPLSKIICEAISDSPYFVASQNDPDFYQVFSLEDYRHLSTEHLIDDESENNATTSDQQNSSQNQNSTQNQKHGDKKELFVSQSQIVLSMKMCRGCPAYCAQFVHLCEMAEAAVRDAAVKSQYSRLRSVVDIARNELIQHEFVRLCMLLGAADTEGNFDEEKMNSLLALPEFTLRVR